MAVVESKYSSAVLNQGKRPLIVFLCTPRCGTQWFAKNLSEVYPNHLVVSHEPVENDYNLKINLGMHDISDRVRNNTKLDNHFVFIDNLTKHKSYVEIGWQSIAGLSEFHKRFEDRLRLVHLYRNPVHVAASLVTHNWYTGRVKERFEKSELNPFDKVAILKEYQSRWEGLTLFEKALYYWTEINLRALEIKYRCPRIPFYSLKFEDLFREDVDKSRMALFEVLSFLELDYEGKMLEAVNVPYDDYKYKTSYKMDWENLFKHPQTVALATKLGYQFDKKIDLSRYKKRPRMPRAFKRVNQSL